MYGFCCSPLVLGRELTLGEELAMGGTLLTSVLARLLVLVSVKVVVVHVLGNVLALGRVRHQVVASVGDVHPAGLSFVGKSDIAAVLPSEPSPHSLGKVPNLILGLFVQPMVEGTFEAVGVGADLFGELTVQAGEHIIEGEGVGGEVNPAGVRREKGESLSGPQTVRLLPGGDIRDKLGGVLVKTIKVQFPGKGRGFSVNVLLEDGGPLGVGDTGVDGFEGTSLVERGKVDRVGVLDVGSKFLVGLVVSVIERTTLELDDTSESVHVVNGSGSGNLGTESVSADSGHRDFVFVHESHDVVGEIIHVV